MAEDRTSEALQAPGIQGDAFESMTTSELIERLAASGEDVPRGLPEEILRRPDATEGLVDLVRLMRYWSQRGPGEGWAPIHALHLLAARGDPAGLDAFFEVLRYFPDDLGDGLTEDVPSLLVAFGPDALPRLEPFLRDEAQDTWARIAVAHAVAALGHLHEEPGPGVKSLLLELAMNTRDKDLASDLASILADYRDPALKPELRILFATGKVRPEVIDWDSVEAIYAGELPTLWATATKDPMDHFRPAEAPLPAPGAEPVAGPAARGQGARKAGTPKVGRNDPCPCGSGKKFKRCHGRP